jgi:hypothetical protein
MHNRPLLDTRVRHDKAQDSVTHTHGLTSKDKGKTKNERMILSGAGMSNIAVQRIVNDHAHTWYRVRIMQENGSGDHRVLVYQQPHVAYLRTPTPQSNVGECKGWTGLSPPAHLPLHHGKGMQSPATIYSGTLPAYIVTTQVPRGP